jgi:fumarate reductase (CoM/CoB) subunit A
VRGLFHLRVVLSRPGYRHHRGQAQVIEQTDVAIIGGGLAACAAAIEAAKYGLHVTLLDKGRLGRSCSSCTAGAGFSFACPQHHGDSLDAAKARHAADTVASGADLNDPRLVEAFVDDAPRRVLELEYLGVRLSRDDQGRPVAVRAPAHREPRTMSTLGGGKCCTGGCRSWKR